MQNRNALFGINLWSYMKNSSVLQSNALLCFLAFSRKYIYVINDDSDHLLEYYGLNWANILYLCSIVKRSIANATMRKEGPGPAWWKKCGMIRNTEDANLWVGRQLQSPPCRQGARHPPPWTFYYWRCLKIYSCVKRHRNEEILGNFRKIQPRNDKGN